MILGIDYGSKHIGLALADEESGVVWPFKTIETKKKNPLQEIKNICAKRNISLLVVGYPLEIEGIAGEAVRIVEAFIEKLKKILPDKKIIREDERFTSEIAKNWTNDANKLHQFAAKLIVESWLEKM
ncbi:MAG: Holliday junction resolvase RuvX [Parcubacteria group bacterium]|nr:Holliday junction resolvase RuvX [Parcubacteria group bacterium]